MINKIIKPTSKQTIAAIKIRDFSELLTADFLSSSGTCPESQI